MATKKIEVDGQLTLWNPMSQPFRRPETALWRMSLWQSSARCSKGAAIYIKIVEISAGSVYNIF